MSRAENNVTTSCRQSLFFASISRGMLIKYTGKHPMPKANIKNDIKWWKIWFWSFIISIATLGIFFCCQKCFCPNRFSLKTGVFLFELKYYNWHENQIFAIDMEPGYPISCYWHMVVITGDLLKLVQLRTYPTPTVLQGTDFTVHKPHPFDAYTCT